MDLYPDNKVSQWKTKLGEFVELQDKWEVGLLEVLFPGKVYNVYGNRYYLIVGGLTPNLMMVLSDGTYDTILSVIGEIQRLSVVQAEVNNFPEDKAVAQIRYASRYRRVKILFTDYASSSNWFYFSDDLATMLHFEPTKYHWYRRANAKHKIYAERPCF